MDDVIVLGASGHTGRFVVAELQRCGLQPIVGGRDPARLTGFAGAESRIAAIDDPGSLDRALAGCRVVINCAGPFLDTAAPVIEAALRARCHYLDVTAEQMAASDTLEHFAQPAAAAGIAVIPAMAFFGGLADLLATVAVGAGGAAEAVTVAIALDSWHPTTGTRTTGERNHYPRFVISDHRRVPLAVPAPQRTWEFAAPFGAQPVVELPLSEIVTISHHLRVAELHSFMNLAPLADLRDAATPPPTAADESGRSAQRFLVEVVARTAGGERTLRAHGRDIYAFTAPLVVEATRRLLAGRFARPGTAAPGELFDAADFLAALPLELT